jgi:hypothetical protein
MGVIRPIDVYIPRTEAAECTGCDVIFWNRRGACPTCGSEGAVKLLSNGKRQPMIEIPKPDEVERRPKR